VLLLIEISQRVVFIGSSEGGVNIEDVAKTLQKKLSIKE